MNSVIKCINVAAEFLCFCTFVLQFSVTVLLIVNVIIEYLLLMVDIPSGMTLPGKLLQYLQDAHNVRIMVMVLATY